MRNWNYESHKWLKVRNQTYMYHLALYKHQRQIYSTKTNKVLISSYWSPIESKNTSSSISSTDLNMIIITSGLYLEFSFDLSPTIFCKFLWGHLFATIIYGSLRWPQNRWSHRLSNRQKYLQVLIHVIN